jgi:DNA replicative helicase MCM subunit Mcm2 (Cdc46/Mcm family)
LARAVAPSISGYLDVKKAVCGSKFLAQVGWVQHELLD